MQLVENKDNVERVYSVCYDKEKLEGLLDEIVKKTSYRTDGVFTAPSDVEVDFQKNVIISGASLPNGDPIYENIKRIYKYTSNSVHSYHNDSIGLEGTEVTAPLLSYIIKDILSDRGDSIYEFLNYETCSELISIDDQIGLCDKDINKTSNFETEHKINALNRLKRLCEKKKAKQYYDVELLRQYYSQAHSLIELQLISEKTLKSSNKILLKDYKNSNK